MYVCFVPILNCLICFKSMHAVPCSRILTSFLNQARAWFLEIAFVREVSMRVCVCGCVCVCLPPRP